MIPFKNNPNPRVVSQEKMQEIYEMIKTTGKKIPVMRLECDMTDSPSVFKKDGKWYLYYISISKDVTKSGYETHIAESEDLINWKQVGTVFRRNELDRWDSKQCAGYAAYPDINWDGTNELQKVNGKYYMSYLAGNSDGYEPDPLYMGMAESSDPTDYEKITRFPEPILAPEDKDGRFGEEKTLYKSFMFIDEAEVTGYKYVNIYNAKANDRTERIFLAVSEDGVNWERYGDKYVFSRNDTHPDTLITGDPQIVKIGDVYVMFYFTWVETMGAYNTFACSYDLVNWTDWQGEPLVKPTCELDNLHAHKTWFVRASGKNYHFYCACNKEGERFICVAISE